jgi:hypothetical protein
VQGSPSGGPTVTTLSFSDPEGGSWHMFIFTHNEAALLRFYSHIAQPSIQRSQALEIVNYVNYTLLMDSGLDLGPTPSSVRYKSTFRGVGIGLPAHEASHAIQLHIARSSYLNLLLKSAYRLPQLNLEQAFKESHSSVLAKLGWSEMPHFS